MWNFTQTLDDASFWDDTCWGEEFEDSDEASPEPEPPTPGFDFSYRRPGWPRIS
jgi:hypothetical protein